MKTARVLFETILVIVLGLLMISVAQGQQGIVRIDRVDGQYRFDTVVAGSDLGVVLRLNNNTVHKCDISTGFRISSPDGADWLDAELDTVPPSPGGQSFLNYFGGGASQRFDYADGVDDDWVAFLGLGSHNYGYPTRLPVGFNDTCLVIRVEMPDDPFANLDRHICIDSATYGRAGYWEWCGVSDPCQYTTYSPTWEGLPGQVHQPGWGYCFLIRDVTKPQLALAAGRARPGFRKLFAVDYHNYTSRNLSNTQVVLTLPTGVTYQSTNPLGTYNPGARTVTWSIGPIAAGGSATLRCETTVSTALPLGTVLTSTVVFSGFDQYGAPFSISDSESETVVRGIDPNDKQAWPEGQGESHEISFTDTLRYQVNFQNVGTDTAFNIVVRDTLSPYLDENSLVVGPSSHAGTFSMANREMVWTFTDIKLPDSLTNPQLSEGFVSFKVKPRQDIPDGTFIANRASICFDFNPPVATNTVEHKIRLSCCTGTTGNVDGAGIVDLSDLSYMVDYLSPPAGPTLPCADEANVNGEGIVDLSDLSFLVDYLSPPAGPALPPCF